jgi:hypothetical protein
MYVCTHIEETRATRCTMWSSKVVKVWCLCAAPRGEPPLGEGPTRSTARGVGPGDVTKVPECLHFVSFRRPFW